MSCKCCTVVIDGLAARALVDFEGLVQNDRAIHKTKDGIKLDFSAVPKGYGVDVFADVLKNRYQIRNYRVEIGGEVTTLGVSEQQQP